MIFGLDGVGKTYLAHTLPVEDDSRLVYINADPGELTFKRLGRKFRRLSAPNGIWSEDVLEAIYERSVELSANKEIDFIFIDGLNVIGDALLTQEKSINITKSGEVNVMRAYGEMADKFKDWCKRMRDIKGVSVIMITHEVIEGSEENGDKTVRADFPGKQIKGQINRWFDSIGYMCWRKNDVGQNERILIFKPEYNPMYRVKDRSGVLANVEPPDLGVIFKKIQDAGISTSNNDEDALINADDIKALSKWAKAKNVTKAALTTKAQEMFGQLLDNLTIGQLQKVKESL